VELADLVRAVSNAARPSALGTLARFFAAGALLFGVQRLVDAGAEQRRSLRVEVAHAAEGPEIEAAVDEAVLLDFAVRAGWHRSDAIVRERLLRNLAVAGDAGGDPAATIERAIALGIHTRDPIARQRLVSSARRALERAPNEGAVARGDVHAWVDAHSDRYRAPARVRFRQVFLSAQRRGDALDRDATTIAGRIVAGAAAGPEPLLALSDPWPWTDGRTAVSAERLDALFGAGFGDAITEAPIARWSGPIRSSFGLHFVWVDAREDPSVSREGVAARATEDLLAARRSARGEARLQTLRDQYDVVLARTQ
jgi:hypothetical protein